MQKAILSAIISVPLALSGFGAAPSEDESLRTPPALARQESVLVRAVREIVTPERVALIAERSAWLDQLAQCESSGNPSAVNPSDVDGTPSYGLLQFKPQTFLMYKERYGITGELMDPQAQRAIVWRMFDDPLVVWEREFPACVRKIGPPPKHTQHLLVFDNAQRLVTQLDSLGEM